MKNVEDLYHLTPVQREKLGETRFAKTANIVHVAWSLEGELNSEAFEQAWQQLLTRHGMLRTCFLSEQLEEPVQVVKQQVKLHYQRYDWTSDSPDLQRGKLQHLLVSETERGFDLAKTPLFRLSEVRLGVRSFQLILSYHTLLLDEISVKQLFREASSYYRAENVDEAAPIYREYVGWVERQDLAGAARFWRNSLKTVEPATRSKLEIPVSRSVQLSRAITASIKEFAQRASVSCETLIAGAWALALMRERATTEMSIGVVAKGRPGALKDSDRILGLMHNILPLAINAAGDEPVSKWLQKIESKRANLQRYAHVTKVQIRQWIDSDSESPLYHSVVRFHETSPSTHQYGITWSEPVRLTHGIDEALLLDVVLGDELSLTIDARQSDDATIKRLLDGIQSALVQLTCPVLYQSTTGVEITDNTPATSSPEKQLDFSLFYFADDNAVYGEDKYRLYREGAKFADRNRLTAVWTPERHFHEKAGLYPNPSVLSAALATITEHIELRAGSVVLPLHNSLRVAEEWSVVDNLSRGRVGVSFTSGWMPNDFAFFPERYATKRDEMFRGIQEVQELWRGNPIAGRDGVGKDIELRIFPKPIRPELPIWLTCSGGPEMFEKAGELGCHVLTALLAQSIEEVEPKIKLYRESLARHGHDPEAGIVTMMLHTFVGEDPQEVLHKVRAPLTNYLKSHLNLIETGAESLNLQVDISKPEYREMYRDQLAEFAFQRYYRANSLIGTPTSCLKMVDRLKAMGVDEVACLIDFGVDVDSVMESLDHLVVLKELSHQTVSEPLALAV
jgi:natural product biosynthesis luciferase-like monooxygenase protein